MNSLLRSGRWCYQRGKRNLGGSKTSPNAEATIAAIRTPPCCVSQTRSQSGHLADPASRLSREPLTAQAPRVARPRRPRRAARRLLLPGLAPRARQSSLDAQKASRFLRERGRSSHYMWVALWGRKRGERPVTCLIRSKKNPRFTGVLEADEGTRTLDLLHGKDDARDDRGIDAGSILTP